MADVVYLNGKFVPSAEAVVPVTDRGFTYGDGLFETLVVRGGKALWWEEHCERLARGAVALAIQTPAREELLSGARQLIRMTGCHSGVLRIQLTRGSGPRGYSPKGATCSTVLMTLHERLPRGAEPREWRVVTSSVPLPPPSVLTRCKTTNRLPQVLAKAEADAAGADEALLLDGAGHALEGSSGNLFWVVKDVVHTPPVSAGVLPGVTREHVLRLCRAQGIPCRDALTKRAGLRDSDGVFFSLTTLGIVEARALDGQDLARSPITGKIRELYQLLEGEAAGEGAGA